MQQLSVFVENRIGSLFKVTHAIYESGINLRAISAFDTPDYCVLRMVVDQPEQAKIILMNKGFAVKITEVLAIELQDKPGELDRVLELLAEYELSINYIYSCVLRGEKLPLMVMNMNDMKKAEQVLLLNGISIVGSEQGGTK
jgi:hypothetical protein